MRMGVAAGRVHRLRLGALMLALAGFAVLTGLHAGTSAAQEKSAASKLQDLRKKRTKAPQTAKSDSPNAWTTPDDVTYVDELLDEEWKALAFPVAEEASDGEFIRRASLDIIGRIPTFAEIDEFLKDRSAKRRENLVNRLLASEEYGRNWANIWTRLLLDIVPDVQTNGNRRDANREALHSWLEKEFNRNSPWNEMVWQLVGGTGRWDENGATNFLLATLKNNTTSESTAYMTRYFLCVQTQCVECHNHPWNEWKQANFHGLNAFFVGTRERREDTTLPNGQRATEYIALEEQPYQELTEKGTYYEQRNGLTIFTQPTYLDGRDVHSLLRGEKARKRGTELASLTEVAAEQALDDVFSGEKDKKAESPIYLRQVLANVITAEDNPYFARAAVNRLWYHYLGHSFIKSVDDFDNGQDEPSMPDLLDRLARDFRAHGHDMKRLTRWICTSRAYSLSSRPKGKSPEEQVGFFTYMLVKPLTPVQLYESLMVLTRVDKASRDANTANERQQFLREFERTFGTNEVATGVPKYDGTITQALMMMNSPLIHRATSCAPGTFLHSLATDQKLSWEDKIEKLYMAALCRKPTGAERKDIEKLSRASKTPEEALQDVMWVLINTGEFLLNY